MSDEVEIEYDPGKGWNPAPRFFWACPGCGREMDRVIPYDPEAGSRKSASVRAEIQRDPYCEDCES